MGYINIDDEHILVQGVPRAPPRKSCLSV